MKKDIEHQEDTKTYKGPPPVLVTDRLLAKSVPFDRETFSDGQEEDCYKDPWPHGVVLTEHLEDVGAVARAICETQGEQVLAQIGLTPSVWLPRLTESLTLAARLHDIGKANDRFQAMVKRERGSLARQPVRHEALSVYMLLHPELLRGEFLTEGDLTSAPIKLVVVLAILGHHIKYFTRGAALLPGVSSPDAVGKINLLLSHADFQQVLSTHGWRYEGGATSVDRAEVLHFLQDQEEELWDALLDGEEPFFDEGQPSSVCKYDWGRLLAAVKALLLCCDGVGSAVPQQGASHIDERVIADWTRDRLSDVLQQGDLDALILAKRGTYELRAFQKQLARADAQKKLVLAGCGSGKTLGAYVWANVHAKGRKLFFCYPTTGTATEGFGDYIMLPEFDGSKELIHGKSFIDLEYLKYDEANVDLNEEDLAHRLRGMESLSSKVTVCTVDGVLGLMQNHSRGLYSSAALMNASFVFDEVHAYDSAMWSTLLDFLKFFPGANVLLMSASLPDARKQELADALGMELDELIVHGPAELETLKRYEISRVKKGDEALERAITYAKEGKKILFVCNTVARCKHYAEKVGDVVETVVYHSRFKYADRIAQHKTVVDRFKEEGSKKGMIALTTQVAEMSLDLDADILMTELAPVPALIQRMGRLNRRARPGKQNEVRPCFVIELDAKSTAPYVSVDLDLSNAWIDELGEGNPLSQQDLSQAFRKLDDASQVLEDVSRSSLIAKPVHADRGQLREGGYTGSFLCAEDCEDVFPKGGGVDQEQLTLRTIPMPIPRGSDYREWNTRGFVIIAPRGLIHYSEETGAEWNTALLTARAKMKRGI